MMNMQPSLLSVDSIALSFGGLLAVDRVSFAVETGQIFSIIGPNGAGKTTVFNCISGFYAPNTGNISFNGHAIEGQSSHKIAQYGLVRTFQNIRLFKEMTVLENLLVAQHNLANKNLVSGIIKLPRFKKAESKALDKAEYWLDQLGLVEFANREASSLAYGQQRSLEIARCMVTEPTMLLLDEPAAGLNPKETKELDEMIVQLRDKYGITVLLIEHDMKLVMNISDRILVLDQGRVIANDLPSEVQNDPAVISAYLGQEEPGEEE